MSVSPYIFFDGTCEEAIAFYQQAIGAELLFKMTFGEMPKDGETAEAEGCGRDLTGRMIKSCTPACALATVK